MFKIYLIHKTRLGAKAPKGVDFEEGFLVHFTQQPTSCLKKFSSTSFIVRPGLVYAYIRHRVPNAKTVPRTFTTVKSVEVIT